MTSFGACSKRCRAEKRSGRCKGSNERTTLRRRSFSDRRRRKRRSKNFVSRFYFQDDHAVDSVKSRIDLVSNVNNLLPLSVGIRFRNTRVLVDAGDRHFVMKFDFTKSDCACNWCRRCWLRRTSQGNVPFAGQQSGSRVESDPACARKKDFSPGMKIGKVRRGSRWSVKRFHIRLELD